MSKVITFFDKKVEYRCLSNFWEGKIIIVDEDIREYDSGELCFHGEKYTRLGKLCEDEERKRILLDYGKKFVSGGEIKSSKEAKMRGGKGVKGLRLNIEELKIWNKVSEDVQYEICKYKLENDKVVKEWLKKSGNKVLIHPAMRCKDEKMIEKKWEGRMIVNEEGESVIIGGNKLGNIWMEMREEMM